MALPPGGGISVLHAHHVYFIFRNLYEQDRLLNRIEELLTNFDAELRLLRHDKFKLDITMKNADLR